MFVLAMAEWPANVNGFTKPFLEVPTVLVHKSNGAPGILGKLLLLLLLKISPEPSISYFNMVIH